jgi:hypothetical protein
LPQALPNHSAFFVQLVWKVMRVQNKMNGFRTVLKEKVWLGTYHTPINAAVHHDFYKVVLAVEGCIFTCMSIPTCTLPLGKKKTHKLKLNFGLDELPALMYKAVKYSKLWNHYKQDAERYVFRYHTPEQVQKMLEDLINAHCTKLRQHIVKNEMVRCSPTVGMEVSCVLCELGNLLQAVKSARVLGGCPTIDSPCPTAWFQPENALGHTSTSPIVRSIAIECEQLVDGVGVLCMYSQNYSVSGAQPHLQPQKTTTSE